MSQLCSSLGESSPTLSHMGSHRVVLFVICISSKVLKVLYHAPLSFLTTSMYRCRVCCIRCRYYLFEGCQCATGSQLVFYDFFNLAVAQCIPLPSATSTWWQKNPWIFVIIALVGASVLAILFWYGNA